MARVSRIQTSLNSGELSPLLHGRPDLQKWGAALKTSVNMVPLIQGPGKRRGGFRFIAETKNNGKALFVEFVRSRKTAYALEFGAGYIRFFTMRGRVVVSDGDDAGAIYEIASPYTLANLFDDAGRPKLTYTQSGDIVYLACPDLPPHKLSFKGVNDWAIEEFIPKGGPWNEPNPEKSLAISVSGNRAGAVTLTASSGVFKEGHVGGLIRLELADLTNLKPWAAEQMWREGAGGGFYCRSDGKTYLATATNGTDGDQYPYSGSVTPTHTRGAQWDGSGEKWIDGDLDDRRKLGILWEYQDAGYGIAKITEVTSETTATAEVVEGYELPAHLVGSSTWLWQFGAWSKAGTFPAHCTFFRERLVFAGGTRVWMSKTSDFGSFEDKTYGEINTDNAVTVTVITERGVDTIAGLASMQSLVVISGGGETIISEAASSEPLGPENVRVQPQSSYGGLSLKPLKIGGASLFIQSGGCKAREIAFSFSEDTWIAPDMTILSEHVTKPGILAYTYQQEPYSIVWCVRADGALVGFTRDKEQDVTAWHRHVLGGGAAAESVASIPSHDSPDDDLYIVARVDVEDGDTRRFVCVLDEGLPRGGSLRDAFFVDCGKTVESAEPITEVPALEHLEGLEVSVLADGGAHANRIVRNGRIALQAPAKTVHVGLGYESRLETMFIEAGSHNGTAQGAKKLFRKPVLRLFESAGGEVGDPASGRWQTLFAREVNDGMDTPVSLVTGDIAVPWPGGWNTQGSFGIRQTRPLPLCVVALIFTVETSDL